MTTTYSFLRMCLVMVCYGCASSEPPPVQSPRPVATPCTNRFDAPQPNVILRIRATDSLQRRSDVNDIETCKRLCLEFDACRSITFRNLRSNKMCYLNKVNSRDDDTDTLDITRMNMTLVERHCSGIFTTMSSTTATTRSASNRHRRHKVCSLVFHPAVYRRALRVTDEDKLAEFYSGTLEICKERCLAYSTCRSVTFIQYRSWCTLNKVNHRNDGIQSAYAFGTVSIERACSDLSPNLTLCTAQFDTEQSNTVLNVRSEDSLRQQLNVPDIEKCMEFCSSDEACRSVTFQESEQICYLNKVNNRDDGVETVAVNESLTMTLVERKCSEPLCGKPSLRYPPKRETSRIVGGEEANPHSWPWMVALQHGNHTFCGGSVLSKRWILTAAHCVHQDSVINPVIHVLAGVHNKRRPEASSRIHRVARIHKHPGYAPPAKDNDLALLELTTEVEYSDEILPICLPSVLGYQDQECVTTGWGKTKGTGSRAVLNQVVVPLIPHSTCSRPDYYGSRVKENTMICAGYEMGTRDSCKGDSGGPLMCSDDTSRNPNRYRLHGVTNWGRGCANEKKPGVYAKVYNYVSWIQQTTKNAAQIY